MTAVRKKGRRMRRREEADQTMSLARRKSDDATTMRVCDD
jgi:hypothetical protein